jgi:hypothetical protein
MHDLEMAAIVHALRTWRAVPLVSHPSLRTGAHVIILLPQISPPLLHVPAPSANSPLQRLIPSPSEPAIAALALAPLACTPPQPPHPICYTSAHATTTMDKLLGDEALTQHASLALLPLLRVVNY